MITVRPANLEEVIAINKQIPEFETHFSLEDFKSRLIGKNTQIIIALYEEQPAGFLIYYFDDINRWASIAACAVLPHARRKGAGREMFSWVYKNARDNGHDKIKTDVNNKRPGMIHFLLDESFYITGIELQEGSQKNKIFLQKDL